jgi:hypothetical protein
MRQYEQSGRTNLKDGIFGLNDIIFSELIRLNYDDLEGPDLTNEVNRARAVAKLAERVTANLMLAYEMDKTANIAERTTANITFVHEKNKSSDDKVHLVADKIL